MLRDNDEFGRTLRRRLKLGVWVVLTVSVVLIAAEGVISLWDPAGLRVMKDLDQYFRLLRLDTVVYYRHRPLTRLAFKDWSFSTNSLGLPGPEISSPKPDGTFRVLILGDASAFGWGVPWTASLGSRLAPLLSAKRNAPVEVVVDAVASWNPVAEVRDLYQRFDVFDPDAVLLMYTGDGRDAYDEVVPELHGEVGMVWDLGSTPFWQRYALIGTWRALELTAPAAALVVSTERTPRITPSLLDNVSWLRAGGALCRAAGIPFRLLSFTGDETKRAFIAEASRFANVIWWDYSMDVGGSFVRSHRISPSDNHFNNEGIGRLAELVADSFDQELFAGGSVSSRSSKIAGRALEGENAIVPELWGHSYGAGLVVPAGKGQVAFLLRISTPGRRSGQIGLEWSPGDPSLPSDVTDGVWVPVILPAGSRQSRTLRAAFRGVSIETTRMLSIRPANQP